MAEKKRKRRWMQFSLRTVFILLTCFCVWFGFKVNRARKQEAAVNALQELGCNITYDYRLDRDGAYIDPTPDPPRPQWLRRLLSDHFFDDVVMVTVSDANDEKLRLAATYLTQLTTLKSLQVSHSEITDTGIAHLCSLGQVRELWLGGNRSLTGKSIPHLSRLTNLRTLELWHANIDDDDLQYLRGLHSLEKLEISFTQVTDRGLHHLSEIRSLRILGLNENAITDAGVKELETHKDLEQLDLGRTQVTDGCVPSLSTLKSMKDLSLLQTDVTPEGIRRLAAALPNAKISYP